MKQGDMFWVKYGAYTSWISYVLQDDQQNISLPATWGALRSLVTAFFNLAPWWIWSKRADRFGAAPPLEPPLDKAGGGGGPGPGGGGGGGGGILYQFSS